MITNPHKKRHIALLISSAFLVFDNQAYALQELSDSVMSQTDAQDGINMTTAYDQIDIARVYWQDKVGEFGGADKAYGLYLDGVTVKKTDVLHPDLGATYKIDFSTVGANAGLTFDLTSYFDTMSVDSFKICTDAGASCGSTFGAFAVQQSSNLPMSFKLATTDGLLNLNSVADLEIGIKNFNLYLSQQTSGGKKNQFIAKDFNFNFKGKGYIGVDADRGIVLETGDASTGNYVDLLRVADSNPLYSTRDKAGLNLEYVYKSDVLPGDDFSTTGAKGVLHLGASGRVTNASIEFKGASDTTDGNILGFAYPATGPASTTPIMGSTGLKMRMKADFTQKDITANDGTGVTLELGHAGTNAYGLKFSNLTPLLVRTSTGLSSSTKDLNINKAYFDSGNVYINLANTKRLQMPLNSVLNAARFKTDKLTTSADYSHLVHNATINNPNELTVAVRGMEFQAISRLSTFTVSNDVYFTNPSEAPDNISQTWGLGLPIYNLNANIATYGTDAINYDSITGTTTIDTGTQAIGFGLGLSTQGINYDSTKTPAQNLLLGNDGSKTTSILLIDGKANSNDNGNPTNYYFGLRNIDMLITANGVLDLKGGKIHIYMPKLTIAAAMELAAGYLPGSRYVSTNFGTGPTDTCTSANETACYVPVDNFIKNTDVFLGLKLRLDGSMDLSLVPGGDSLTGNRLSFEGNYNLTDGAIQLSDFVDGSILGLDNLTGNIGFNNQIKVNKDSVDFNYAFTFNPNHSAAEVFRIKDVNLYPPTSGVPALDVGQRLGEFAMTGGTLITKMNIRPRD